MRETHWKITTGEKKHTNTPTLPYALNTNLASEHSGSNTPLSINTRRYLFWVQRLHMPMDPTRWHAVSCESR